jgi:hypothetical protein
MLNSVGCTLTEFHSSSASGIYVDNERMVRHKLNKYGAQIAFSLPSLLVVIYEMTNVKRSAVVIVDNRFDSSDKSNSDVCLVDEEVLTPGVYTFSTTVGITGDIHFQGSETDIFIIQIASNLIQDATLSDLGYDLGVYPIGEEYLLQVAGFVTVQAGVHMEGILLVKTAVTFMTGSSLNGRILAQTACALQKATITRPVVS